jgi:pantetheine-phosphate adenylyltransferase
MVTAVYPGSFDPIHNGHVDIATRAANVFERLIVAVYARPQKKVLFTAAERTEMVRRSLCDLENVTAIHYNCTTVELVHTQNAQVIVRGLRMASDFDLEYQMALTNKALASDIETFCLFTNLHCAFLSSTTVKEIVIAGGDVSSMVPAHVQRALEEKCR